MPHIESKDVQEVAGPENYHVHLQTMFDSHNGDSLRASFCNSLNLPATSFPLTPNFVQAPSYYTKLVEHFHELYPNLSVGPVKTLITPTDQPELYRLSATPPKDEPSVQSLPPHHHLCMLRGVSPRTGGGHVICARISVTDHDSRVVRVIPFHDPHPDGSGLYHPYSWIITFPPLSPRDCVTHD